MTAPLSDDAITTALAEGLANGWGDAHPMTSREWPRYLASELLPTVRRLMRQQAAHTVERATDWLDKEAPDTTSADISWDLDVTDADTALAWAQSSLRDYATSLTAEKNPE